MKILKRPNRAGSTPGVENPSKLRKLTTGVGGNHPAWDIIIIKLDFQSQMKISQQNQHLADVVELNAEHELRKFRRHIRDDKYMLVNISKKIKYINSIKALENAPTERTSHFTEL